jgi:hypothetical protein
MEKRAKRLNLQKLTEFVDGLAVFDGAWDFLPSFQNFGFGSA